MAIYNDHHHRMINHREWSLQTSTNKHKQAQTNTTNTNEHTNSSQIISDNRPARPAKFSLSAWRFAWLICVSAGRRLAVIAWPIPSSLHLFISSSRHPVIPWSRVPVRLTSRENQAETPHFPTEMIDLGDAQQREDTTRNKSRLAANCIPSNGVKGTLVLKTARQPESESGFFEANRGL